MPKESAIERRQFLRRGLAAVGAAVAAPLVVPAATVGRAAEAAPSDRIMLGAMGIGGRGGYVFGCMLHEYDVRCVAVCDVRRDRRERAKRMADSRNGDQSCTAYIDYREMLARPDIDALLIATGPNWHATASIYAAKAGKDVYCEKPCTKNIAQSLELAATYQRTGRVFQGGMQRRSLPGFMFAVELARTGRLGRLVSVHAHPAGMGTHQSGWAPPEPEPPREEIDWDLYLGPAAWRPFNRRFLDGFNFEKGGGMIGGGVLEWGSHCVDLCQWANDADNTVPVEYDPPQGDQATARYANGVRLVMRNGGWLPNIGSCPVRFEGDAGWVETGDSGDLYADPPSLLANRRAKVGGYPADFHVRNFFDCVKSRALPRANHIVSCNTHIACHATGIAIFLRRKLTYDPVRNEFVNDAEANRLRSEAVREPFRL